MGRMRIAIDINDVIRDFTGSFCDCYTLATNKVKKPEDVKTFHFKEEFYFETNKKYKAFRYLDYPFELHGKADPMDEKLPFKLNQWVAKTLKDVDADKVPEVMLVSPLESNLTIQATYFFLSKISCRIREVYFPVDSSTVWDRCDILITANPKLIAEVPEGKHVIKIEASYNKEVEAKYTFKSLTDVIQDEKETVINIIYGEENEQEQQEETDSGL